MIDLKSTDKTDTDVAYLFAAPSSPDEPGEVPRQVRQLAACDVRTRSVRKKRRASNGSRNKCKFMPTTATVITAPMRPASKGKTTPYDSAIGE